MKVDLNIVFLLIFLFGDFFLTFSPKMLTRGSIAVGIVVTVFLIYLHPGASTTDMTLVNYVMRVVRFNLL